MIFTEDYNIADKYRLSDGEKVSTVEMMPARFTSLDSSQYGPVLDDAVRYVINKYFHFELPTVKDPHLDDDNDLYVYHLDGVYQEFFCKKFYEYKSVGTNPSLWKLFVDGIGQPKFNDVRQKIDKFTGVTDETCTYFTGITLSPTGDLISIRVYDSLYDLSEIEDNDFLSRVNDIAMTSNDLGLYRTPICKGSIDVYPDSDLITYRLNFKYAKLYDSDYEGKGIRRYTPNLKEYAKSYLDLLSRDGGVQVLTGDQVAFIESKLVGESYFNLEYDVNPDGTVAEVYAYINTVHEFKDLTTQ